MTGLEGLLIPPGQPPAPRKPVLAPDPDEVDGSWLITRIDDPTVVR